MVFLRLETSAATAESKYLVYNISLFTFESSTVTSLVTLYLYIKAYFLHGNKHYKCTKRRKKDRKPYHPYDYRNPCKTTNQ
jgi:hypothetical protein